MILSEGIPYYTLSDVVGHIYRTSEAALIEQTIKKGQFDYKKFHPALRIDSAESEWFSGHISITAISERYLKMMSAIENMTESYKGLHMTTHMEKTIISKRNELERLEDELSDFATSLNEYSIIIVEVRHMEDKSMMLYGVYMGIPAAFAHMFENHLEFRLTDNTLYLHNGRDLPDIYYREIAGGVEYSQTPKSGFTHVGM